MGMKKFLSLSVVISSVLTLVTWPCLANPRPKTRLKLPPLGKSRSTHRPFPPQRPPSQNKKQNRRPAGALKIVKDVEVKGNKTIGIATILAKIKTGWGRNICKVWSVTTSNGFITPVIFPT